MRLVVISDFDGTIVQIDTAALVLKRFAKGDWKRLDEQLENGEITLEICLREQFSLVRASKEDILREVAKATCFRPNFDKLANYCKVQKIPLVIASAGLDFCIVYLLAKRNLTKSVTLRTATSRFTTEGVKFTSFRKLGSHGSHNFKDALVRKYRRLGFRVVYIGDTSLDYQAAKVANLAFAVRGSHLAQMCKGNGVRCEEFWDFQQ